MSTNESKIRRDRNLTQSHTSTKMKRNSYLSLCQNKFKAHARTQAQEFSPTSAIGNSYMWAFKSTITLVIEKKKRYIDQIRDKSVECRGITFARVELEI